MPIYEYNCEKCGLFELLQKITDDKIDICPTCGHKLVKGFGLGCDNQPYSPVVTQIKE